MMRYAEVPWPWAGLTIALVLLAQEFAGIESQEATMTAVDRLGFHLRLRVQDGMRGARIAVLREVRNPTETRRVLVEMAQQARSQADLARLFRSAGIDAIQLRTDHPYGAELGRFFETRERRRLRG